MQLLVLAAGAGKRIKPIVTSKPLLPLTGKTLLEQVVDSASILKPEQIVIVVNPKDKATVVKLLPQVKVAVQEKPTGMAGAVLAAKAALAGPAVIVNGDDLIGREIFKQVKQQINNTPDKVILTGIKHRSGFSGGFFIQHGQTLKIAEQPAGQPSRWFKIVLDYFPKVEAFIRRLGKDYEASLNQIKNVIWFRAAGRFYQLKFPWQILDLTAGLLTGRNQIDPTAKILSHSEVINSYLGPGVMVGQNCLVRDSIIEAGTVVGFGTEIARSYIGPKNNFHRNYIGDSVIEGGSNFGAGAVIANYRFDHKTVGASGRGKFGAVVGRGAQVGINASLMPGAMIEAGQVVWPGEIRR
jgi:glucose-1-phosphate thymidylyltransferase